jgi:hypothetical protein
MNYKISLQEMNLKGKSVLSKQPKQSLAKALKQAQKLKQNTTQGLNKIGKIDWQK